MDVQLHFFIGGDSDSGMSLFVFSTFANYFRTRHFAVFMRIEIIKTVSVYIKKYLSSAPLEFNKLALLSVSPKRCLEVKFVYLTVFLVYCIYII